MRNIKIIIFKVLVILFISSFYGCPNEDNHGDSTLTIVNNSDKGLVYLFDTSIVIGEEDPFDNYWHDIIKPFSKKKLYNWWKKITSEEILGNSYMRLYLFDNEVANSIPWDTIRIKNLYLKRIDFNRKILDSLNWTLSYP